MKHLAAILFLLLTSFSVILAYGAFQNESAALVSGTEHSDSLAISQPQEIYLEFRYGTLISTVVTCFLFRDSVYLPITELFRDLKLYYAVDSKEKSMSGFYLASERRYKLSFLEFKGELDGQVFQFRPSEFLVTGHEFYCVPGVLAEMFGLHFSVHLRELTLSLATEDVLPIVQEQERELRRKAITAPPVMQPAAPLLYPYERRALDGGFLDYSISSAFSSGRRSFTYYARAGAQLLGGDIESGIYGEQARGVNRLYKSDVRWRYVLLSNRYLTQVLIGDLVSVGLNGYQYRGLRLTNEPVEPRRFFAIQQIEKILPPDWEVEAYLNGQLYAYARSTPAGRVEIPLPMGYGSNVLELRYFGPQGQQRTEMTRIDIPYFVLPKGELNYTLELGRVSSSGINLIQAHAAYAPSEWLTGVAGVDYVADPLFRKPIFYNLFTMRLFTSYIASVEYAPSLRWGGGILTTYPSNAGFQLSFRKYFTNPLYNAVQKKHLLSLTTFLPTTWFGFPLNYRLSADWSRYPSRDDYLTSFDVNSSFVHFYAAAGYRAFITKIGAGSLFRSDVSSVSLSYYLSSGSGVFRVLHGAVIGLSADYRGVFRLAERMRFYLSLPTPGNGMVQVSVGRDLASRTTTALLYLTLDLPFTRSTTSMFAGDRMSSSYSETVRGSIGFDRSHGRFVLSNLESVGRSGASFRMFVDTNLNGKYDEGETIIPNASVDLQQATAVRVSGSGIARAWDLLPYTRYNVRIAESSLSNPLWVPSVSSFSFVASPDAFTPLDVPFYTAAVVDGMVLKEEGEHYVGLPGLTVHVRGVTTSFEKELRTFADGSYYLYRVAPGEYEVYPDSAQLQMLALTADPPVRRLVVKGSAESALIENVDFVLRERKGK